MVIYLDQMSPPGSSNLPESRRAALCFLFGLASSGVYMCPVCYQTGGSLLHCPSTLTGKAGGIFLLHCPWSHLRQTLSGTLPCEARTFLSRGLAVSRQRPPVLLTTCISLSQNHGFVQRNHVAFPYTFPCKPCCFSLYSDGGQPVYFLKAVLK